MKELSTLMKRWTFLAVSLAVVCGLPRLGAQEAQPRPVFSTDAAAESILNLDALKAELESVRKRRAALEHEARPLREGR
jgi:cell division protein FtsB